MSHATAVREADDEMIVHAGENSHAIYYKLGKDITVTWMPGYQLYCCLACRLNSCTHIDRVHRWRVDQEGA